MGKTVQKTSEQNSSEQHSLNNGTLENQSNWSRCNSFSSSSSDSSGFCTSFLQKPIFPLKEKSSTEGNSNEHRKRRRNSSGSSASSNLSCVSDKDTRKMPVLLAAEPISSIVEEATIRSSEILTNFSNMNSSTLTLQHQTLFGNKIPHSIEVNSMLPFRHNLRRNIRRKTCSCDCTATCTTYRVRQFNGVIEKTVEKETVISRTEVKTCVETNTSKISPVKMSSSNISYEKQTPSKNECNRKRRSEIQQLYASLSEIKWAKNFSPDNILRQFDVRQAASCSAFGRSPEDKSVPSGGRSSKRPKLSPDNQKSSPTKRSPRNTRSNNYHANNSYKTRSKDQSSPIKAISAHITNADRSPPTLEKNDYVSPLKINSNHLSSYSDLSKESSSPDASINKQLQSKNSLLNGNCTPSLRSSQNHFSSCNTVDLIPKKFLNFDFKTQSDVSNAIENMSDFTPSFLNIAEESIRTIDACFREVGAEVVVSACFEAKYGLPRLTSVEARSSETSSSINDTPPVLEPLLSIKSKSPEKCSDTAYCNLVSQEHSNSTIKKEAESLSSTSKLPSLKFFPSIDSKSLPEKEYSPSLSCFDDTSTDSKLSFTFVSSTSETNSHNQEISVRDDPPVLELCINASDPNYSQKVDLEVKPKIENMMIKTRNNSEASKKTKEMQYNSIIKSNNKISKHCNSTKSTVDHVQLSRSLIIEAGRRIFNKYLKFARSKSTQKPPLIHKIEIVEDFKKDSKFLSSSANNKLFALSESLSKAIAPKISTFHEHFQQMPKTASKFVENALKVSPLKSQKYLTSSDEKDDSSMSIKLSKQTSETVSLPHETEILSVESHQRTVSSIDSVQNTTVIQTFNQKISYSKSPEKVTLKHEKNSSVTRENKFHQPKKKDIKTFNETTQNSLIRYNTPSSSSSSFASASSWTTKSSEEIKHPAEENVNVPPRVFTCQYRTIKIIHGNNYIQIILKVNSGSCIFLTHESLVELKRAISKAANDKDCRLLILNGYGKTFCLGLDLNPIIGEYKINAVGEIANAVKDLITTLATFYKPLVAIVNGAAYGLGMTILNHADIIIATQNATFCMPYSKLGYMPEGGATVTLPEAIGTTRAMDLLLKGNVITAEQAKSIGLVNEVVSLKNLPRDLVSCVRDMAERSLSTMETTKAMMKMHLRSRLLEALENEVKLLPQMWLSPSCQESILRALESELLTEWTKY